MASGSVFSGTLQTITSTKLDELSKQHSTFQKQYTSLLSSAAAEHDPLRRLVKVVDGTKLCLCVKTAPCKDGDGRTGRVISGGTRNSQLETDLKNVDRFLEQAKFDPSVSPVVLKDWEEKVMRHVTIQATKFQYADLYGKLVTEWLSAEKATCAPPDDVELSEGFEELPSVKKLEARKEWEKSVFEPAHTDIPALNTYLEQLFITDKKKVASTLMNLRKKVRDFESTLASRSQFDSHTLQWVIRALQTSDLLSNEKREVLGDFLKNEVILAEIADVLNMRLEALDRWTWGDYVLVEQQRQINGQFQILMHEDIVQAIFLHYIGIRWSVFFKSAFLELRNSSEIWRSNRPDVPKSDILRRGYFLGNQGRKAGGSLDSIRSKIQRKRYFTYQLMDNVKQQFEHNEGEEEAEFTEFVQPRSQGRATLASVQKPTATLLGAALPPPAARSNPFRAAPPPPATGGGLFGNAKPALMAAPMSMARRTAPEQESEDADMGFCLFDDDEYGDDSDYDDQESAKNPMAAKQSLLHILATEIILNTRLNGETSCFRTVFESWNPLLPHDTTLVVLEFFGISDRWKTFFKTYLEAPLKFADDDQNNQPRVRRRGAPGSHALSDVFGEVVLFCLDFSVNQDTGGALLHRLYDDIWFWNKDHDTCIKAWASIRKFAEVTGTQVSRSLSSRWFLYINPRSRSTALSRAAYMSGVKAS